MWCVAHCGVYALNICFWTCTASVAVFGPTACCASSVCLGSRFRVIGRGNLPSLFVNLGRRAGVGTSLLSLDCRASVAAGTVCLWTIVLASRLDRGMSLDYRGGGGLGNVCGLPCSRLTTAWVCPWTTEVVAGSAMSLDCRACVKPCPGISHISIAIGFGPHLTFTNSDPGGLDGFV